MVVIWSGFSKLNLKNFVETTLMSKENSIKYIKNLVEYVNYLEEQHFLGKILTDYKNIKIYQLIYKKHRILYCIIKDNIYIISVLHTIQSPEKTLESIRTFFES